MNKKVLSALLFGALMAGTGTFTSCIDTDEPAGIENLRGAKAELIRAKVAVEAAEAARLMAVAEYEKAKAAHEQADAAYRLAEAKYKEAETAAKEAQTAQEQARFENEMAKAQIEMEAAAKQHELTMAGLEKQLAATQYEHEVVLKQIAIAKALGIDALSKATLTSLEKKVQDLYDELYAQNGLADQIRTAEKNLYDATLNKEAGNNGFAWIPTLELNVVAEEVNVAAKEEKVAKLESFLEKDTETTDWRAEIETLTDSVEVLKHAKAEKDIELAKAKASEEYLTAYQKVYGISNNGFTEKGTIDLLADAKTDYNAYAQGGTLSDGTTAVDAKELSLSTIKLAVSPALTSYVTDGIAAAGASVSLSADAKGNNYITIQNTVGADDKKVYKQPVYGTKLNAANNYLPALAVKEIESWEKALAKTEISAQSIEQKKRELPAKVKAEAIADSIYNEIALPVWQSALAVMDGGAATATIPAEETKKVTDAIAAYNAKVAAATAAATAYTTAYNNIFDTDSVAKLNELYNKVYWDEFKGQAQTDLKGANVYNDAALAENAIKLAILELEADDYEGMIAAVEALYVTKVKDNAATTTVNEATEAQKVVDKALSDNKFDAKAAADKAQHDLAKAGAPNGWEYLAGQAGAAAVKKDTDKGADKSTILKAKAAKETAAAAVPTAYTAMKAAYETYNANAKKYYALVPATGAKGLPASGTAVAEADAPKMVLLALSDKEADLVAAWNNASEYAFGVTGRYVEMAEKDVTSGALYNWAVAKKALATCQDEIAAADKLAELVEALADAKANLATETAANEAKFADLKAAIAAADEANKEANEELAEIEVEVCGEINIEIAKLNAKINAIEGANGVMTVLSNAVNTHLHGLGVNSNIAYSDAEAFEKAIETAVLAAKKEVATAEKNLAAAEVALQKAKDGKYDSVANAQYELDKLMAEYEIAMAEYEKALADFNAALEIMLGE